MPNGGLMISYFFRRVSTRSEVDRAWRCIYFLVALTSRRAGVGEVIECVALVTAVGVIFVSLKRDFD
jgi:hypothetical protein